MACLHTGRVAGRGVRDRPFVPWLVFWPGWAIAWMALAGGLVGLARYIWAPFPPEYPPGAQPEGQGEGMAFLFFFLPGLLVLAVLTLVPVVVSVVVLIRRCVGIRRAAASTRRSPWPM